MITEITTTEAVYYDYRLVLPTGSIVDRKLPLFLRSGDILHLEGYRDYRVMECDPSSAFTNRTKVYLESV